jgi:hypothetical protein
MADVSDVQSAIVTLVSAAIYPNGTGQASVAGVPVVIYPGWPDSDTLTADLAAEKCHVTVFAGRDERNTTRFPVSQQVTANPAPSLTLSVAGQVVTVGGTVSTPQNVMLLVNGKSYAHAVQANDTLDTIAAALAALVATHVSGTSATGAAITIGPTGFIGAARAGGFGTVATEWKRQERIFTVTVWADTPAHRDALAGAADVALASQTFLTMPDSFKARIRYRGSPQTDALQKETLYRRDLKYAVEFATTEVSQLAQVIIPSVSVTAGVITDSSTPINTTYF